MRVPMTPGTTIVGSMLVFTAVVAVVVFWPTLEDRLEPSRSYRSRTGFEDAGRQIYIANGCQYCHSQYVRPQDWDYGTERPAQAGDYVGDTPPLLGSERQGPAARYLDPQPFNFTYLRKIAGPIGGMLYHQVMNGITGTSMPPFKTELESEKIWDVSSYVAVYFAGGADTDRGPRGIPASYEPAQPGETR